MGTKEFALGAELAMRGAGIRDQKTRSELMNRVTQMQLDQQAQRQSGLDEASGLMQQMFAPVPTEVPIGAASASGPWGGGGWSAATGAGHEPSVGTEMVAPKIDFSQLAQTIGPSLMKADPGSILPLLKMMQPGGGEKTPTTAMGAYLQKLGPNATIPDIIKAHKDLGSETDFEKGYRDYTKKYPGASRERYKRLWDKETKEADFINRRNEIMHVYGVDEQTATGIATGVLRLNQNQLTGELSIVDMVSGTGRPVKQLGQGEPQVDSPKRSVETLWNLSDLATGAASAAKAAWGATAGQVPGVPIAEQTEYARQRFGSAQNNLIRSLSINPRYPVAEMRRIKEEIKIAPSFFDSPKSLRVRMRAIDDYLRGEVERNTMVVSNKGMPVEDRKGALQAINVIQHFLDNELGVPTDNLPLSEPDIPQYLQGQIGKEGAGGQPSPGDIESGYQFKGGDPGKPSNWIKVK